MAATFYWSRRSWAHPYLTLLDWGVSQMVPEMFSDIATRLDEMATERRARFGAAAIYVEEFGLAMALGARGIRYVRNVPEHLTKTAAWDGLWNAAAVYVRAGDMAMTDAAARRAEREPLPALDYTGGPRPDEPTTPAYLLGIVIGLDEALARDPHQGPPKRTRGQ